MRPLILRQKHMYTWKDNIHWEWDSEEKQWKNRKRNEQFQRNKKEDIPNLPLLPSMPSIKETKEQDSRECSQTRNAIHEMNRNKQKPTISMQNW